MLGFAFGTILIGIQTAIMRSAGDVKWVPATPNPITVLPVLGFLLLDTREELAFRGYKLRFSGECIIRRKTGLSEQLPVHPDLK